MLGNGAENGGGGWEIPWRFRRAGNERSGQTGEQHRIMIDTGASDCNRDRSPLHRLSRMRKRDDIDVLPRRGRMRPNPEPEISLALLDHARGAPAPWVMGRFALAEARGQRKASLPGRGKGAAPSVFASRPEQH